MKIRPDEAITVCLHFTLPDGGPACDLVAVLVSQDRDAYVYRFVNLAGDDFGRLSECVRPVPAEEPAEQPITSSAAPETPASGRPGVHETILVVEDESGFETSFAWPSTITATPCSRPPTDGRP